MAWNMLELISTWRCILHIGKSPSGKILAARVHIVPLFILLLHLELALEVCPPQLRRSWTVSEPLVVAPEEGLDIVWECRAVRGAVWSLWARAKSIA